MSSGAHGKDGGGDPPRSALDWPRHAGVAQVIRAGVEDRVARRNRARGRAAAAAAAAMLMLAGVFALMRVRHEPRAGAAAADSVIVSAPLRQTLPDGTIVELNAGAEIRSDYTGPLRRVELMRGEAHFAVARDPSRPFVVQAGGIEVRALGTAFVVQLAASNVEVLVTEGSVAVERTAAPVMSETPPPAAVLTAGGRAVVDLNAPVPVVKTDTVSDPRERLAWRTPRLEFSRTPLSEALQRFNDFSRERLVLADESLGRLRLTGIVRADNTPTLLQLLEVEFGVVAVRGAEGELLIRRK